MKQISLWSTKIRDYKLNQGINNQKKEKEPNILGICNRMSENSISIPGW